MENITRQTTAQTPSRFGMPTNGHLWTSVQGSLAVAGVVRDRAVVKAGVTAIAISVPGDNAWRPPTC